MRNEEKPVLVRFTTFEIAERGKSWIPPQSRLCTAKTVVQAELENKKSKIPIWSIVDMLIYFLGRNVTRKLILPGYGIESARIGN